MLSKAPRGSIKIQQTTLSGSNPHQANRLPQQWWWKCEKDIIPLIYYHVGALGAAMGGIVTTTTVAKDATQLRIITSVCAYVDLCINAYIYINVPLSIWHLTASKLLALYDSHKVQRVATIKPTVCCTKIVFTYVYIYVCVCMNVKFRGERWANCSTLVKQISDELNIWEFAGGCTNIHT